ncbi:probable E3 ubiquitin-protein ligase ZFP1 [Vicia villosa]|uniref:probable E3 ubiquitin-protein ligase ZFP1 n=1 Tax=Vicia villosa TaxID=3911 RepID=UPI00273A76F2|nr:probable E3 ubiquitin-protein ligase ZFP1 [Vicia villosa]
MSHQFRLVNWNEDNSPTRDARTLRYLMDSNSPSSFAFNNRIGLIGTRDQTIPLHTNPTNNTTSHTINGNYHPTITNISNYNDNQTSPSPHSSPPKLFGSSLILAPTIRRSTVQYINTTQPSSMNSNMTQLGTAGSNFHQVQSRTTNNNNGISTSFNNGINNDVVASATITSTSTSNGFLKRSRSSEFVRGESSNQGSQVGALRRRTNPPPHSFQHETMNNNIMSSTQLSMHYNYNGNSGFSSMVPQQVNHHGVSATQNSIIDDSHINNRRHAHASPISFFDDTPSYNSPYEYIIDDNVACLIFPSQQEIARENFTMTRRTEPTSTSTSTTSLYPSAMTGGSTQVTVSTSPFQRNNNFLSFGADSSLSSHNPRDIFDSIEQRSDDTFIQSTINVQQYVRFLPEGQGNRFLAPSTVHVWSNNFVPRWPQRHSNPSTSGYNLNPPPSHNGPRFSTAVEYDQYMQSDIIPTRSRNRRRSNNHIFTSTSREHRAQRNRHRDEVILALEERMRAEARLTEEQIHTYIETETYVSNPNETSTQNETCTICQEDYVEGEIIGRLDCKHLYHLECIKQWLMKKNTCPICKKIALDVHEDEDHSVI